MKSHQAPIGENDEWLTPPEIITSLGVFDLDPYSPVERPWPTAKNHFSTDQCDGLSKQWFGRVWLNPPFNRFERPKWMRKMVEHGDGIMMVPAACETKPFKDCVWGKCSGLLFLNHRPHYHYVTGERAKFNSGCTMVLVAYGKRNLDCLVASDLGYVVKEITG